MVMVVVGKDEPTVPQARETSALASAIETITPENLLARIDALLENNRGVFIGENHGHLLAPMFLARSMQDWEKKGVSTLYIELDRYSAQALLVDNNCLSSKAGLNENTMSKSALLGTKIVMDNAAAAGMRVIGSDSVNFTAEVFNRMSTDPEYADRIATGGAAMDARDDYSTALIDATYDGRKFILYGGNAHSGNETSPARPSMRGLDQRLGIPSIDFEKPLLSELTIGDFLPSPRPSHADVMQSQNLARHENRQSPVFVTNGADRATLRVTSRDEFALVGAKTAVESPEGAARLKEAAEKARAAGACNAPAHLNGRELLSADDIENLARDLKKSEAAPQQGNTR